MTATELAESISFDVAPILTALAALEGEGFVMRGRYRPGDRDEEWCERRLLARIHRRTIADLRKRVEPVSPATFMRFLMGWHRIVGDRMGGPEGVAQALCRLQGYAAPAALWESSLLPVRSEGYLRADLDQLVAAGRFVWLRPPVERRDSRRSGPVRNTPIMLVAREQLEFWQPLLVSTPVPDEALSSRAQRVLSVLRSHGAVFFADLVQISGLLRTEAEQGLAELVACGLVTCDSFAGLRALITPPSRRASFSRPRRAGAVSVDAAGRWALLARAPGAQHADDAVLAEHAARALLDRYGVVFRALLQKEARWLPRWRDLVRVLRRLEARGEVRGGRFVNGFSGEQFAWPDAVDALRHYRNAAPTNADAVLSAADPLSLAGIVTPGVKVPIAARNRVLYRDGVPVALYVAGEFRWLGPADPANEWSARNQLVRNDPALTYIQGSSVPS